MAHSRVQGTLPYKLRRDLRAVLRGTDPPAAARLTGHVRAAVRRDPELVAIPMLAEWTEAAYAAAADASLDQGQSLLLMRVLVRGSEQILTELIEARKEASHAEQGG